MRSSKRRPVTPAPSRRPQGAGPGRAHPPRLDSSRPQQWFAQQLILVLSGQRPVHSLLGHAREPAYEQLIRLAPDTPLRSPDGAPALRRVGVCRPASGVLEAFARIRVGDRTQALAFRLEHTGTRWHCTAIDLGPRPMAAAG